MYSIKNKINNTISNECQKVFESLSTIDNIIRDMINKISDKSDNLYYTNLENNKEGR